VENGALVDQGGHRLALTLEQGHGAIGTLARKLYRLSFTVEVGGDRVGPVEDRKRRIASYGPPPPFQLLRRPEAAEFNARLPRRRLQALRAQLAGHEANRHDAVLLSGFQQPRPGPIACRFVLEADLVEARQRVADVGLVVDRQTPDTAGIDVGKGAVG